jgi:hypothetical protein
MGGERVPASRNAIRHVSYGFPTSGSHCSVRPEPVIRPVSRTAPPRTLIRPLRDDCNGQEPGRWSPFRAVRHCVSQRERSIANARSAIAISSHEASGGIDRRSDPSLAAALLMIVGLVAMG